MITMSHELEKLLEKAVRARTHQDYQLAHTTLREVLAKARETGDPLAEAAATVEQGIISLLVDNDTKLAHQFFSQALQIYAQVRSNSGSALAMSYLARIARQENRVDEAYNWTSKALALYQEDGDSRGQAVSLHQLGLLDKDRGEFNLAEQRFNKSLVAFESLDDKQAITQVLLSLAGVSVNYHKNMHQGRLFLARAIKLFDELGFADESEKVRRYLQRLP